MGGGLQQKRRRKEARSVHVPTEEKAEVNQQVLRELGAWISFFDHERAYALMQAQGAEKAGDLPS